MRTVASFIRVIGFMFLAFFLLEYIIDSGEQMAIVKYPIIWAVLIMLLVFTIAIEIVSETLKQILFRGLTPEAQERYLAKESEKAEKQFSWVKMTYKKLLGSRPLEEEAEIILDHNYDGIKELDNKLPPWWVYGFYVTIIFAVVYLVRYEVLDGSNQAEEYEIAVAEAKLKIEEYKRTAKGLVDVNSVVLLTDAVDLDAGRQIFMELCIVCHKEDGGGGIGPNLTDEFWILGGGIKNVFNTISEGGRNGKGMVSWKADLKPLEMAQVGSYVLSLQGTTPKEPKAAEGIIWVDPDVEPEADVESEPDAEGVTIDE
jgi:cytochrome c oxidase cbb3-type subunit 3